MSLVAEQVPGEKKIAKRIDQKEESDSSPEVILSVKELPGDHPYRRPKL
jgi:hypothetical protein